MATLHSLAIAKRSSIRSLVIIAIIILVSIVLLGNYNIQLTTSLIYRTMFIWSKDSTTYTMPKNIILRNRFSNFSKFRCTGDENNIDTWRERLCVFNNICYNVKEQHFQYYRQLRSPKFPLFYDSARGMLYKFDINQDKRDFLSLTTRGAESWAPSVVDHACPSTNVTWFNNLHTLWREYFNEINFGHLVWEDIGSIFYSLERMNEFDEQLVVMHVNPVSKEPEFPKFVDNILAVLTSKELVEYKSYLASFNTSYVCFRRFIAGGNLLLFHSTVMKENHGREVLLYKWRSKIISYHKFDPEYTPYRHQIIITNKSEPILPKATTLMHRAIVNLKEVVMFVRQTYPHIPVHVVEWHKIPIAKQIELLLNTTIFISPPGGVSMVAPFLPRGSHAIIMDYYVTHDWFGFSKGSSASMEGMFLNHFPHFKKDYYQIYGEQDYVMDFPGAPQTRDHASIIVNVTRLHLLIESALEDMSL